MVIGLARGLLVHADLRVEGMGRITGASGGLHQCYDEPRMYSAATLLHRPAVVFPEAKPEQTSEPSLEQCGEAGRARP